MADGHDAHDAHDDHGHDDHGHGHDDHGDHGDHGDTSSFWVVPPLVIGLVVGAILVAYFGLASSAPAVG